MIKLIIYVLFFFYFLLISQKFLRMAFNHHSALKAPLRMNQAKLDFQLPRIPFRKSQPKKKLDQSKGSIKSNSLRKIHQSQEHKNHFKNIKNNKVVTSHRRTKIPLKENRQSRFLRKQSPKLYKKSELSSKHATKSTKSKQNTHQLPYFFECLTNTISKTQGLKSRLDSCHEKMPNYDNQKIQKRSILACRKYRMRRSNIMEQIKLSRSTGNVLQDLQIHMSSIYNLQQQSSNCLKQYIENRSILQNLQQRVLKNKSNLSKY